MQATPWPERRHWPVLTAGLLLVVAALMAAPVTRARADAPSREIQVNVAADQGEADGRIDAQLDIAAPAARVWSAMLDCERATRYLTALKSCRVLEKSADGLSDIREHRSQWLSMLPETVSVFRSTYVPNREIQFERVSGDFRFLKGAWRLQPLAGGTSTRVTYTARIGVSVPLPSFVIRAALEADVPKFLSAFRQEVERTPGKAAEVRGH